MLASAPASKIVRRKVAVRSVWRTPGASCACTSAMARSVMRSPSRMHDSSSGVLVALALLMIRPASMGAPLANRIDRSRRSALVHSSMAITAPFGTRPPSRVEKSSTPSSKSRCDGPVEVVRGHPRAHRVVLADRREQMGPRHRQGPRRPAARSSSGPHPPGATSLRWHRRRWCCRAAPGRRCPARASPPAPAHPVAPHPREFRRRGDACRRRVRHQSSRHQPRHRGSA